MIEYKPILRKMPIRTVDVPTAWKEVAEVLEDILNRFNVQRGRALEFGVDYGYSTSCLANYFNTVIGVDHFVGDVHAGDRGDGIYSHVKEVLKEFPNITLIPMDYQSFISTFDNLVSFDFIHIDIVHNYAETFECGDWAVRHAPVVMFHDTLSFPDVMQAVGDLAIKYDLDFYNVPEQHGVGVLVRK